ncbi:unnamed protein product [Lathyrus sativus]|nr:unnamed protein product [Lathyrus sativus]
MASLLSNIKTPLHFHCFKTPFSFGSSLPLIPSLSYHSNNPKLFHSSISSLKATAAASDSAADNLLEKHVLSQGKEIVEEHCYDEQQQQHNNSEEQEQDKRVRWKDPILQDTVSLVGFVKMILHSGRYENGEKLSPEHEKMVLEKLLPYHPHYQKKIGTGVDYITIGHHPDFDSTRCLFIVRKDGERVDFSYWKCIKGLVRRNAEKTSRHMFEE